MACGAFIGSTHNWGSWSLPASVMLELTIQEGEKKAGIQSGDKSESHGTW